MGNQSDSTPCEHFGDSNSGPGQYRGFPAAALVRPCRVDARAGTAPPRGQAEFRGSAPREFSASGHRRRLSHPVSSYPCSIVAVRVEQVEAALGGQVEHRTSDAFAGDQAALP